MTLFPAELRYIKERINFGDYQIQEINVDLLASTVCIKIMGETVTFRAVEQVFLLRFTKVSAFAVRNALGQDAAPFVVSILEVESHEVRQIEPDLFEFLFTCHGPTEIAIQFKEFAYEIIDGANIGPSNEAEAVYEARASELDSPGLREFVTRYTEADAQTHYRLGNLALNIGDYSLAAAEFTLAAKGAPHHTPTRFLLAKSKYFLQEYEDALALIEKILAENSTHPAALLYQVRILGATQQWNALTQLCDNDVRTINGEVRLWHILALMRTNRVQEAELLYRSVSKSIRDKNPELNRLITDFKIRREKNSSPAGF